MPTRLPWLAALALATTLLIPAHAQPSATEWRLTGQLSEACSCSVPCTCNFGESPSPHHFCWALFSLDIRSGKYENVVLDGLHMAGALGGKGVVLFVDDKATAEQTAAMKTIWRAIYDKVMAGAGFKTPKDIPAEMRLVGIYPMHITQEFSDKGAWLKMGDMGGFDGKYIMGIDGKTPVIVENNWSWNIQKGIKGKTGYLRYKDRHGNAFDFQGTNMNQGRFDWSDQTKVYFR